MKKFPKTTSYDQDNKSNFLILNVPFASTPNLMNSKIGVRYPKPGKVL